MITIIKYCNNNEKKNLMIKNINNIARKEKYLESKIFFKTCLVNLIFLSV